MKKQLLIAGFILFFALGTGTIPADGSDGTRDSSKPGNTKEVLAVAPGNAGVIATSTANTSLGATMPALATSFTDEPYYINYKIRTGDFYAQSQEDGLFEGNADPVWHFRGQVGAAYSASSGWTSWECVYDIPGSTAYRNGGTYSQSLTERWSGTVLSDADNIYIGIEGWEDEDENYCTYNSGKDDDHSSDYDYHLDLSGGVSRNTWTDFKNAQQSNVNYVDCGTEGNDGYFKIDFDVWWNYVIPVAPSFSLDDPTLERLFTITLTNNNNYRVTSWDYQLSDDSGFGNIVAEVTGITANTADIGELPGSGDYYVRIRGTNEAGTGAWSSAQLLLTFVPVDPVFTLTDPTGERLYTITLTDKNNYRINSWDYQLSDDYEFNNIVAEVTGITENTADIGELPGAGTYYVRIRGVNEGGTGDWTFPRYLSTSMGCETGFCPPSITVHHYAGSVAPVDATITYEVVESNLSGTTQCWITRNLGAASAPTSSTVSTEAKSGWYWQFNRKQGYNHSGALLTPSTTWETSISEVSSWSSANDPCALLLGDTWHIPTSTEWNAAITNGSWSSLSDSYASLLIVHTGQGILEETSGALSGRGSSGRYWSSTSVNSTQGYYYTPGNATSAAGSKMGGCSLRCIRSY